jgi:1-acyl-sn-glycerol-3-phosphate acyltransferase
VLQPDFGLGVRAAWYGAWPLARVIAAVGFSFTVEHRAPQPRGPLVIAANHHSHLDPPVLGLAVARPMRFLALDELWGNSVALDFVFRAFRVVPLSRTAYPLAAMRTALQHLAAGGRLGVFPEGRRAVTWGETTPKRGAAWLALRTGVPLLPVAIGGTDRAMPPELPMRLHRAPIRVVIGRPLDPDTFRSDHDPAGALTEAWRRQVDEELRHLATD